MRRPVGLTNTFLYMQQRVAVAVSVALRGTGLMNYARKGGWFAALCGRKRGDKRSESMAASMQRPSDKKFSPEFLPEAQPGLRIFVHIRLDK